MTVIWLREWLATPHPGVALVGFVVPLVLGFGLLVRGVWRGRL